MKEKESALYSHYVIDGVFCEATPAELLDECMEFPELESADYPDFEDIVDESTEPPLGIVKYDPEKLQEYIKATVDATHNERSFSLLYPEHFTSLQIAKALLDSLGQLFAAVLGLLGQILLGMGFLISTVQGGQLGLPDGSKQGDDRHSHDDGDHGEQGGIIDHSGLDAVLACDVAQGIMGLNA